MNIRIQQILTPLVGALLGGAFSAILAGAPTDLPDLPPGHSLSPRAVSIDPLGRSHTRLEHRYQGLRVWGSEVIVHGDPALATPASPSRALPRLALAAAGGAGPAAMAVDVTPSIPLPRIQATIRADLGAEGFAAAFPEPERVIVPQYVERAIGPFPGQPLNAADLVQELSGYALAYLQRVEPAASEAWDYLVDAHSGAILQRIPVAQADQAAKGTGNTLYSGKVILDVTATGSGFKLVDPTRGAGGGNQVLDMSERLSSRLFGQPMANAENVWGDGQPEQPGTNPDGGNAQTVGADAAYGMQSSWDYFKNIHGRAGIDGNGGATRILVHERGVDNAQWNGNRIEILGTRTIWPCADPFILGHEFGHGVTAATAGLIYKGESGGLNEATSDIFGAMIRTYARAGDPTATRVPEQGTDWLLTFHPIRGSAPAPSDPVFVQRSMINPQQDRKSLNAWGPALGQLNPHHSSGPMNRAFYFLSQGASADAASAAYSADLSSGMKGLGNDRAVRIWYQALTSYLKPDSTYLGARKAALQAAADLYGKNSDAVTAVAQAFAAIRVGSPTPPSDLVVPSISLNLNQSGTDLELSATSTGIRSVSYMLDGVPVGSVNTPPFALTLNGARLLANGIHFFSAYALDVNDSVTLVNGPAFALDNPFQQLLKDPGLELGGVGSSPWKGDLTLVNSFDTSGSAHGGNRYAQFDGRKGPETLTLGQAVSIPAGFKEATLRFWAWISANPTETSSSRLALRIRTVPGPGQTPAVLATPLALLNQDAWPDWRQFSVDLSAWAGQTVEVYLESLIGPDSATIFRVDDFSLLCAPSPMVDVGVSPGRLALQAGAEAGLEATVFGSDNQEVLWSVREAAGGRMDGSFYRAPATPGFYHVLATSVADPRATAEVSMQVRPALDISPATAELEADGTFRFLILDPLKRGYTVVVREGPAAGFAQRSGDLAWTFSAGAPGTCHLDVYAPSDLARPAATALITVVPATSIELGMDAFTIAAGATLDIKDFLTSSGDFTWTIQEGAAGGRIGPDPTGADEGGQFYTAPATPGVYHVIIASADVPTIRATVTMTVVAGVAIHPGRPKVVQGGELLLFATVPGQPYASDGVTWSTTGGDLTGDGEFSADAPGSYTVTATPVRGAAAPASVTVTVTSADLDGDGQTSGDFGDLAKEADAYGSQVPQDGSAATDLNGDGVVDDSDLQEAKDAFERSSATPPPPAKRPGRSPLPRSSAPWRKPDPA